MSGRGLRGIALFGGLACSLSCVGVLGLDEPAPPLVVPTAVGFDLVADAMQPSCGTLDCHGQVGRNLRLFGARGLRLLATDNSEEGVTEPPEYEATYWAMVALEPETLATVVSEGGRDPERLILFRKGRGTTRHKGGDLMRRNADLDRCLVEWLKGAVVADPCNAAADISAGTTF